MVFSSWFLYVWCTVSPLLSLWTSFPFFCFPLLVTPVPFLLIPPASVLILNHYISIFSLLCDILFSLKKKKKSSGFGWKQCLAQRYSTSLCDTVISKCNFSWRWNSPCGVIATLFSHLCHTYIPILRITALENTYIFSFSFLEEDATYKKCKMYWQANDESTWWKRR